MNVDVLDSLGVLDLDLDLDLSDVHTIEELFVVLGSGNIMNHERVFLVKDIRPILQNINTTQDFQLIKNTLLVLSSALDAYNSTLDLSFDGDDAITTLKGLLGDVALINNDEDLYQTLSAVQDFMNNHLVE